MSLLYDANGDIIDLPSISPNAEGTLAIWFYVTNLTSRMNLWRHAGGSDLQIQYRGDLGTDDINAFRGGTVSYGECGCNPSNFSTYLGANNWHLLVFRYGTGAAATLNLGNLTQAPVQPSAYNFQNTLNGAVTTAGVPSVGNDASVTTRWVRGSIGGYAWWNGTRLSDAEVTAWWANPFRFPTDYPTPTIFGRCGSNGTTNVPDDSGNGNTGTITGLSSPDTLPEVLFPRYGWEPVGKTNPWRNSRRNIDSFVEPLLVVATPTLPDLSWLNYNKNLYRKNNYDLRNPYTTDVINLSAPSLPDFSWRGNDDLLNWKNNHRIISSFFSPLNFTAPPVVVPELSWLSNSINFRRVDFRKTVSSVFNVINFTAPPVVPLSWSSEYPYVIRSPRYETIQSYAVRNTVPILNPVPDFFKANERFFRWPGYKQRYGYETFISNFTDVPIPFCANRKLLVPVNLSETWEQHFATRSWANIADQIAAGYDYYYQPSLTSASYEEIIDFTTTIDNSVITLFYATTPIVGNITVVVKLATSLDGVTFTPYNVGNTLFSTSFRYVKYLLEFSTTGDKNGALYYTITINASTKREMDGGTVNVLASDTAGTIVNFNKAFKDVETITVTPLATVLETAIYDFVDVPNPTSFKILLYDSAGTRIDGVVSWKARGVV